MNVNLKYWREKKGWTRQQLASFLGVYTHKVEMWETTSSMEPKYAKTIARLMEISVAQLIKGGNLALCERPLCSNDAEFLSEDDELICVECFLKDNGASTGVTVHYQIGDEYIGSDDDMGSLIERTKEVFNL